MRRRTAIRTTRWLLCWGLGAPLALAATADTVDATTLGAVAEL